MREMREERIGERGIERRTGAMDESGFLVQWRGVEWDRHSGYGSGSRAK